VSGTLAVSKVKIIDESVTTVSLAAQSTVFPSLTPTRVPAVGFFLKANSPH
jgi:hypothetical protein